MKTKNQSDTVKGQTKSNKDKVKAGVYDAHEVIQPRAIDVTYLRPCEQPRFCPCDARARWQLTWGNCCDKCLSYYV